jgi:hypothetical protein
MNLDHFITLVSLGDLPPISLNYLLTVNTYTKLVGYKFITLIQSSTGFGSMGPSSGKFLYFMSKRNYIKYITIYMP